LAIAATVATDGAAAPSIGEALGAEAGSTGAAMLGSGVIGAGTGALTSALTGQNILRGAVTGGVTGAATSGIMGAMNAPTEGGTPTNTLQIGDSGTPQMINTAYNPTGAQTTNYLAGLTPTGTSDLPAGTVLNNGTEMVGPDGNTYLKSDLQDAANSMKSGQTPGFFSNLGTTIQKNPGTALAGAGLLGLLATQPKPQGITAASDPNAPQYNFNQSVYRPTIPTPPTNPYVAQYGPSALPRSTYAAASGGIAQAYATGGPVQQAANQNAVGGNAMYPQAGIANNTGLNNPTNIPLSTDMLSHIPQEARPAGIMGYAAGGSLGSYSDGGHMLKGPGDGMSDSIPANIDGKRPARLADSEFVVPADVVSHLGNGSSDAGAKKLYKMMDNVRKARTGKRKQAPQINADKYLPK
jgi:hypothetical protein